MRFPTERIWASQLVTNAAALTVARSHGLAAPELVAADLSGEAAGVPVSVETLAGGSTRWPRRPSLSLLRSAGAALGPVHQVQIEPTPALPVRPRPIAFDDFAADRREGRMRTTRLLDRADRLVSSAAPSGREPVFVHGDVWSGNAPIHRDAVTALIDWKTAGVGDRGVDVGELRKQVALAYEPKAADLVSMGYSEVTGIELDDLPYWDAVAALNTPTDLPQPYRRRRDAFLRTACSQL